MSKKSCPQCKPNLCDQLWSEVERWMKGGGGAKGVHRRLYEQYTGRSQGTLQWKGKGKHKMGRIKNREWEHADIFDGHQGELGKEQGKLKDALKKYETQCKDKKHKKDREKQRQRANTLANRKKPTDKGRARYRRWQARGAFQKPSIGPEGFGRPPLAGCSRDDSQGTANHPPGWRGRRGRRHVAGALDVISYSVASPGSWQTAKSPKRYRVSAPPPAKTSPS